MKKKLVRLTESDLHRIVENSVKRVINEISHETLRMANGKSRYLSDNADTPEDKAFHKRRADKFSDYASEVFNKKFNISDEDKYNYILGKYDKLSDRALRGYKQVSDFHNGKREYKDGKWRNKKI